MIKLSIFLLFVLYKKKLRINNKRLGSEPLGRRGRVERWLTGSVKFFLLEFGVSPNLPFHEA